METRDLANRLCQELVREVVLRPTRHFILTQFMYPDGDLVPLYTEHDHLGTWVSDLGTTLFKCSVKSVDMTPARMRLVESICKLYDVRLADGVMKKLLGDNVAAECLAFCEAVIRVSNLQYEGRHRHHSTVRQELDALLQTEVLPRRPFERNWTAGFDVKRAFPVDYRLNGYAPKHIFHVASSEKSTLVAAVSSFLRLNEVDVPTLAVVDPNLRLSGHQIDRLQVASTEIKFDVEPHANEIVRFALDQGTRELA